MPLDKSIQKVLVIGSGPIVIGQAAEFDYAGAQACRVLKDAGVNVVLCNSNPATIMTDQAMADEIYLEPLTVETVKRIIRKERPDSILAGLGGQTGLTLGHAAGQGGLPPGPGRPPAGNRRSGHLPGGGSELFKEAMAEIGQPVIASDIAETVEGALAVAEKIGYPVIVRPAFTLGGAGGGAASNPEELKIIAGTGLDASPSPRSGGEGHLRLEGDRVRDHAGQRGQRHRRLLHGEPGPGGCPHRRLHRGGPYPDPGGQGVPDAPQGVPGHHHPPGDRGRLQRAAGPEPGELRVRGHRGEPRVSRSSALASKATGYPIAKITTKIALGYTLDEIKNDITGKTCACFEPTLDYIVVKMPKWPFDKFADASRTLGTQMKATGEVMAIAPSLRWRC